jgi:phosphoribosyl-ATP pyrophosphohydrolase
MTRAAILDRLFAVIQSRMRERPAGSYVVKLVDGGADAIAAKIREESEEVIEAAGLGPERLAQEVADLLFHTWVLMAEQRVAPEAVFAVLEARFGIGGLEEKAARARGGSHAG